MGKRKDKYNLEGMVENDKAILTKATDVEKKESLSRRSRRWSQQKELVDTITKWTVLEDF